MILLFTQNDENGNQAVISGKTCAIIAAAGRGLRMQNAYPPQAAVTGKIFLPLLSRPLISWTIAAFEDCFFIDRIVLVLNKGDLSKGITLREKEGWKKVQEIIPGGLRRQDSVASGLKHIRGCQWVVIHDGARPCITPKIIEEGIREASKTGAAIAAIPVKETIKLADSRGKVRETLPRKYLWSVQTPQVFRYDIIHKAYERDEEVTDDASLVEKLGIPVKIYMGSYDNIKVTTPQDLKLAEAILKNR